MVLSKMCLCLCCVLDDPIAREDVLLGFYREQKYLGLTYFLFIRIKNKPLYIVQSDLGALYNKMVEGTMMKKKACIFRSCLQNAFMKMFP